jgi:ferritin-like metal-binding protein YciE
MKGASAMATDARSAVLSDWVGDIVSVESHIEEALDHQLKIEGKPAIIQHVHDTVRDSKHRAEAFRDKQYSNARGQSVTQKATEILGKAAGLIDKVRKDTSSKALRDDYVALNLALVSYSMLHTTAIALENEEVAQFAAQGLKTYQNLVVEVNKALPDVVVKDLIANGEVDVRDPNAGAIAASQQQELWMS